jgi:hypothetical protein
LGVGWGESEERERKKRGKKNVQTTTTNSAAITIPFPLWMWSFRLFFVLLAMRNKSTRERNSPLLPFFLLTTPNLERKNQLFSLFLPFLSTSFF